MQQGEGQGGQLPPQILADQLTLSQPGGADYAYHSTTCPPGFLTLAASLHMVINWSETPFKNLWKTSPMQICTRLLDIFLEFHLKSTRLRFFLLPTRLFGPSCLIGTWESIHFFIFETFDSDLLTTTLTPGGFKSPTPF